MFMETNLLIRSRSRRRSSTSDRQRERDVSSINTRDINLYDFHYTRYSIANSAKNMLLNIIVYIYGSAKLPVFDFHETHPMRGSRLAIGVHFFLPCINACPHMCIYTYICTTIHIN